MGDKVIVEYIWLGASNILRSKTRIIKKELLDDQCGPSCAQSYPLWNYDGSSTGQASGIESEIGLKPVAVYKNPFAQEYWENQSYLLLCDTFQPNFPDKPMRPGGRWLADQAFEQKEEIFGVSEQPWFGIEQEYFIIGDKFPLEGFENAKQGQYYCSVGTINAYYREVAEEHLYACLKAGLNISGVNAEVAPCQWEYQIGPCEGIQAGDQLWISRWLLERMAEKHNVKILWHPKPFPNLNGSGCHTNFSTMAMREPNGKDEPLDLIYNTIETLRLNHTTDMKVYGKFNDKRMSGKYETAKYSEFSFDKNQPVDRGASIRVGYDTIHNKKGYFEDRRPASNMDPYDVIYRLFLSCKSMSFQDTHVNS